MKSYKLAKGEEKYWQTKAKKVQRDLDNNRADVILLKRFKSVAQKIVNGESDNMETRTDGRALYNVRRTSGRGMKRWLTLSEVTAWKNLYPEWRFKQLTEHGAVRSSPISQEANRRYENRNWGRSPREIDEAARWTGNAVISYDDILDVMLETEKGI